MLHDAKGIIWPFEIAPYKVHLVSLAREPKDILQADFVYHQIENAGISVLYDERADVSAGEKFADADLLGMPVRVVVSAKTLAQNSVEVKLRKNAQAVLVPLDTIVSQLKELEKES